MAAPVESNGEATIKSLLAKAATLSGVDGAVAATTDGLLVAGAGLDGYSHENFAAFAPQMFNRLLQYGRELQFGEARHMTIYFEHKPVRLLQAGRLLLAVAGRELEPLPDAELEEIAAKIGQAKT